MVDIKFLWIILGAPFILVLGCTGPKPGVGQNQEVEPPPSVDLRIDSVQLVCGGEIKVRVGYSIDNNTSSPILFAPFMFPDPVYIFDDGRRVGLFGPGRICFDAGPDHPCELAGHLISDQSRVPKRIPPMQSLRSSFLVKPISISEGKGYSMRIHYDSRNLSDTRRFWKGLLQKTIDSVKIDCPD